MACALSLEVHKRNCQIYETPNELSDIGGQVMTNTAVPDGHPGANPTTRDLSSLFRPLEGSGACLADKSLTVMGKSVVIPWSQTCDPLRWMGHIAFAFALLHGAFLVMRKL